MEFGSVKKTQIFIRFKMQLYKQILSCNLQFMIADRTLQFSEFKKN